MVCTMVCTMVSYFGQYVNLLLIFDITDSPLVPREWYCLTNVFITSTAFYIYFRVLTSNYAVISCLPLNIISMSSLLE